MSSRVAQSLLSRLVAHRSVTSRTSGLASLWTTSTSANKSGGGKPPKGPMSTGPSPAPSKNVDPPAFVFKQVGSDIGPGAGKDKEYKNPEYFSYHQLSYADMDSVMANLRCPQPSSIANKS